MINLPTPDSVAEWALERAFDSPSLVVSMFLLLNSLWAWWSLGRSTVNMGSVLLDRSHDQAVRHSFKRGAGLRTAVAWTVLYLPASLVTQIWAGSAFSHGQGGGLRELLLWSGLFGLVAVVGCIYVVPSKRPKYGDPHWMPLLGLCGGYLLGALWALMAFTVKNGPEQGDWWVCPALSCIGVLGASLRMRIKALQSRKKTLYD